MSNSSFEITNCDFKNTPNPRELDIQQSIRIALGNEPDLVLWRNSAGVATHDSTGRSQRFGLCVGASDLIGVGPFGRLFALEVKSATGRLSDAQQRFLALVRSKGGFACVVRSVEESRAALIRARHGELQ